jgi:repressor of nif and glnA expression
MDLRIGGIAEMGKQGKPVLNAPVETGMVGIAAYAGVNGMAAVEETGIRVDTHPISTVVDFSELKKLE